MNTITSIAPGPASAGALCLFLALVASGSPAVADPDAVQVADTETVPAPAAASLFDEAVEVIRKNFRQELSREEIELRALRALVAEIDPYGLYLDADEWQELEVDHSAQIAGVGVQIRMDDEVGLPRIRYLLLESAAGAAGARRNDWIESINGEPTAGKALEAALPLLRGAPGTKVELGLRRPPATAPLRVVVERKVHLLPSVHGVARDGAGHPIYLLNANEPIGYIRISRLAEDSLGEVQAALRLLQGQGAHGLILDLRNSTGGLMSAGVNIADLFLDSGLIAGHQSRVENESFAADPAVAWSHPLVVLINAQTASSSEFLAAALRDHNRARFVGQRTYGKGLVQVMFPLAAERGGLILSTGRHLRPAGPASDRNDPAPANANAGVAPDTGLELVVEGEEYERWSEAMDLRASGVILEDSDLADAPPDRVLALATELLTMQISTQP